MTLKNEIFEGIAAYKGLTPTPQDDYYKYRLGQLKKKQKDDDAVEQAAKEAVDAENKRRAQGGPPGTPVPTVASTATPGSPQTAMNTSSWDPTQAVSQANMPVDRRGGMIHRFADGGSAPGAAASPDAGDLPDAPPVDNLIKELLARGDEQAAERISRDVGEPWTVTGPTSEWAKEGADQRVADLAKTRGAQARDEQAFQTSAPTVQPSTRAGRVLSAINEAVSLTGSSGEYERRQRDLAAVRQAREKIPGLFTPSTSGETATAQEAAAAKQREVARGGGPEPTPEPPDPTDPANVAGIQSPSLTDRALDTARSVADAVPAMVRNAAANAKPSPPPVGAGAGTAAGAQPQVAAAAPAAPASPAPRAPFADRPSLGLPPAALQTTPSATTPPVATAPVPPPARPSGPTGTTTAGAPPPNSAGANAPSTAPKGSLGDQSRVTAFDPTADLNDPRNAHRVDQSGQAVQPTQQDMHAVLSAGLSQAPGGGAQQPPPGQGAVSRPVFNQWIAAHDQGGKLTPGQALMVGMVGKYKVLLSQGRQAEASQMAWGLMQAANLEAASWGDVAMDQIRANNLPGAVKSVANAADLQPDGMHHRPSADGRSIETYDNQGKLTATTPMDGRAALAAALGLQDGTLMWNALQTTVASTQKPDRNAEGRQLTNELRRQQIEGARLRNRKLAAGPATGGGSSTAAQELAALFHQTGAAPPGGSRPQGGGEDDSWIDRETTNLSDDE